MALTDIQKVRLEVADNDPAIPLLSDDEYNYFLEKSSNNIYRASLDAAKTILFKLSQRTNETVDIFTLSGGSKSAEQYRLALQFYINNNALSPINQTLSGYVGGVYKNEMLSNDIDINNNLVPNPGSDSLITKSLPQLSTRDYFSV